MSITHKIHNNSYSQTRYIAIVFVFIQMIGYFYLKKKFPFHKNDQSNRYISIKHNIEYLQSKQVIN